MVVPVGVVVRPFVLDDDAVAAVIDGDETESEPNPTGQLKHGIKKKFRYSFDSIC